MKQTRREFLVTSSCVAAAGCAALASSGCHTNSARMLSRPAQGGAVTFKLSELPELQKPGGAVKVRPPGASETVLLWRDATSSLRASAIKCTHLGSEVEVSSDALSLYCPSHGSQYAANGAVRKGPAKTALRAYAVQQTGDDVSVSGFGG